MSVRELVDGPEVRVSLAPTTERDSESINCLPPYTYRLSPREYCYEEGPSRGATGFRAKLPTNPVNRQRREEIPRRFALCAGHVVIPGGASPLRAVMTGTARLGKGVRREAESEGSRSHNSDPTNRNRIQGRRGGVTRQWTGTPDRHPDTHAGKSGGNRGKEARLTPGDLPLGPDNPDYRPGNGMGDSDRSQPRP
jgi:hypothetical protein